jgi:hypothetical protein
MSENTLFSIYKEQFETLYRKIKKILENFKLLRREIFIEDYEKYNKEAERLLKQMELDINLDAGCLKFSYNKKKILDDFKCGLQNLNKEFKLLKEKKEYILNFNNNGSNNINSELNKNSMNLEVSSYEPLNNSEIEIPIFKTDNTDNKWHLKTIEIENFSQTKKQNLNKKYTSIDSFIKNINFSQNLRLSNSNTIINMMRNSRERSKIFLLIFCFTLVCMFVLVLYSKFEVL